MKKKVKLIVAGVAACGVVALFAASAFAPLTVEQQPLELATAEVTFTEQGSYTYESSMEVAPNLTGSVEEIFVKEGQRVKKGDPIVTLSATDVEYQIQRLQNDIKGYNAQSYNLTLAEQKERNSLLGTKNNLLGQLTTVESQISGRENSDESRQSQIRLQEDIVAQDRANVRLARDNLYDYRDEYDSDSYDSTDNQYRMSLNDAKKALAASEQRLLELQNGTVEGGYYEGQKESLNAQIAAIDDQVGKSYNSAMQSYYYSLVETANVSIAELTEKQGQATITAPCDGIVSALPVTEMVSVDQGVPVATIGVTPMVEVFVPVREIDGIRIDDKVTITVSKRIGDIVCTGTVTRMDSQAAIKLSPLGVEESKVRVLISTADKAVGIGYQVDVEFTVYREENCITVPQKALFQQDGQDYVWVNRENTAQIQPVVKSVETRSGAIISEGLAAGDVIIADANIQGLVVGKRVA